MFRPLAAENLCAIAEKMLCQLEQRRPQRLPAAPHPAGGGGTGCPGAIGYGARELRRQVDRAMEQALLQTRIAAGTA